MWASKAATHQELMDMLRHRNIVKSSRIYQAMLATDRGNYIKESPYVDSPQPIGHFATISAPHMHGYVLEDLEPALQPGRRVLDVGCGSGYLVACAARLVGCLEGKGYVLGIDVIPELVELAKKNIERDCAALLASPHLELRVGDGWEHFGDSAFDVIHVGATAETVPDSLLVALAPGGRMMIPVGPAYGPQEMFRIIKDDQGHIVEKKALYGVTYVPLIRSSAQFQHS